MSMYERAKQELILAGYNLDNTGDEIKTDKDYADKVGICALEVVKVFCDQGHSGMSASFTIALLEKLLKGDILTPLTNNPDEWILHTENEHAPRLYQSKRKHSCFSSDELKTYYDIDDDTRTHHELNEAKSNENRRTKTGE